MSRSHSRALGSSMYFGMSRSISKSSTVSMNINSVAKTVNISTAHTALPRSRHHFRPGVSVVVLVATDDFRIVFQHHCLGKSFHCVSPLLRIELLSDGNLRAISQFCAAAQNQ